MEPKEIQEKDAAEMGEVALITWEDKPTEATMIRLTGPITIADAAPIVTKFKAIVTALAALHERAKNVATHLRLVMNGKTLAEGQIDVRIFDSMLQPSIYGDRTVLVHVLKAEPSHKQRQQEETL